jgi:RNA polymerase sigma-70 factor (ECF subfamily)
MQQRNTVPIDESQNVTLFDLYGEILFSYIQAHTATREDAEDLTVDVFAAACEYENLSTLTNPEEQLAWLKKVAHNRLIDYYRWKQRHPSADIDQFTEILFTEQQLPEETAIQHEAQRELRQHISQLSPFQQRILHLRYGYDLRCPEIAHLLGKREGAIRQILARTIQELRTLYQHSRTEQGKEL